MDSVKSEKGFTLMEMLIVVTIIGVITAIVLPRFITTKGSANKSAHRATRQAINSQLEQYNFTFNTYPAGMTTTDWGGDPTYKNYFPDGIPTTCNQGVAWTISAGRLDTSTHASHE